MTAFATTPTDAEWAVRAASRLVTVPVGGVMGVLGELVEEVLPSRRTRPLALLTGDCARSPMKVRGVERLPGTVTSAELAHLAGTTDVATARLGTVRFGGSDRRAIVVAARPAGPVGSLFAIDVDDLGDDPTTEQVLAIQALCDLTAAVYAGRATAADPDPTTGSLAAAQERARTIVELGEAHEATLTALLSTLRARDLPDATARTAATDVAASALIALRDAGHRDRALSEEPLDGAFDRLREQLRPVARYASTALEFAGPESVRSIPAELANAARAITRGITLVLLEQEGVGRILLGWQLAGDALVLTARDDGPGALSADALVVHRTAERVQVLGGELAVDAVPGWGTTVRVSLPLAPVEAPEPGPLSALNARERQVLAELVRGARNSDIATTLTITSHTVKFHVANILRKTGAKSRGEAAAIARDHGLVGR